MIIHYFTITQINYLALGERLLSRTEGNRRDDETRDNRAESSHVWFMARSSYTKLPPPRRSNTSGDGVRSYTGANIDFDGLGGGSNLVDEEPNTSSLKPAAGDLRRERDRDARSPRLARRRGGTDVSVFANSTRSRLPNTWRPSSAWTHSDASLLLRNSTKANPAGLRDIHTSFKRPNRPNSTSNSRFVTSPRFPTNSLLGIRLGTVFLCCKYSTNKSCQPVSYIA